LITEIPNDDYKDFSSFSGQNRAQRRQGEVTTLPFTLPREIS